MTKKRECRTVNLPELSMKLKRTPHRWQRFTTKNFWKWLCQIKSVLINQWRRLVGKRGITSPARIKGVSHRVCVGILICNLFIERHIKTTSEFKICIIIAKVITRHLRRHNLRRFKWCRVSTMVARQNASWTRPERRRQMRCRRWPLHRRKRGASLSTWCACLRQIAVECRCHVGGNVIKRRNAGKELRRSFDGAQRTSNLACVQTIFATLWSFLFQRQWCQRWHWRKRTERQAVASRTLPINVQVWCGDGRCRRRTWTLLLLRCNRCRRNRSSGVRRIDSCQRDLSIAVALLVCLVLLCFQMLSKASFVLQLTRYIYGVAKWKILRNVVDI